MYRVERYCPIKYGDRWVSDPTNPYFILQNAMRKCDSLILECHSARVVNAFSGQVLYQV